MSLITKTIVALGAVMMLGAVQASPVTIHKPAEVVSFGEEQNTAPILGFDSTTDLSSGFGLFGQTLLSNNDSGFALGLRSSSQRFSILSGKGEGSNFAGAHGFGADQTYFHGGSWEQFTYKGFDWVTDLGAKHSFGFARVELDSSGLERRSAEKVSFSGEYFGLAYTQVDRAANLAAQSIDLSLNLDAVQFDAKHFTTVAGGQLNELVATWAGSAQDEFRLSLSVQENDLLEDGSDSRLLFQYKRKLGVQLNQAETEPAKKRKGRTSAVLLGGGLVAAALGGSSGSSDQDNSSRFTGQHKAAKEALDEVNPRSIIENVPYSGWIYQTPDGRHSSTEAMRGDVPEDDEAPTGVRALYHTRSRSEFDSDPPDLADRENFSKVVKRFVKEKKIYDGYVSTPLGKFLFYDFSTDMEETLGGNGTIASEDELPKQHAVAKVVLNGINPQSVRENIEYGGFIYQTLDGNYFATKPFKGKMTMVHIPFTVVPVGGTRTAIYHTHANNLFNERFSQRDITENKKLKLDGYLGTPMGQFIFYDFSTDMMVTLGKIAFESPSSQ